MLYSITDKFFKVNKTLENFKHSSNTEYLLLTLKNTIKPQVKQYGTKAGM